MPTHPATNQSGKSNIIQFHSLLIAIDTNQTYSSAVLSSCFCTTPRMTLAHASSLITPDFAGTRNKSQFYSLFPWQTKLTIFFVFATHNDILSHHITHHITSHHIKSQPSEQPTRLPSRQPTGDIRFVKKNLLPSSLDKFSLASSHFSFLFNISFWHPFFIPKDNLQFNQVLSPHDSQSR